MSSPVSIPRFPALTHESILAFQFSSWYPRFSHVSIKSTIIRPLSYEFRNYLEADSIFVPEGSEDVQVESTISDDEADSDDEPADDSTSNEQRYSFPELDTQIRAAIAEYGAVFPKLNYSAPKDASWVLLASSPLKCTSPADVYLLLKSSDFVTHDLDTTNIFEGCSSHDSPPPYELELVLRKWYSIDPSRELRCFVRQNTLIGISQRDENHYDYLNDPVNRVTITQAVTQFWETNIRSKWPTGADYIFDVLLTRDLSRAHIIDFNPYAPRTDPLLFTYDELWELYSPGSTPLPQFKVIDSLFHPSATRNAPAHQQNMLPLEALQLSDGRSIEEFTERWQDEVRKSSQE